MHVRTLIPLVVVSITLHRVILICLHLLHHACLVSSVQKRLSCLRRVLGAWPCRAVALIAAFGVVAIVFSVYYVGFRKRYRAYKSIPDDENTALIKYVFLIERSTLTRM